LKSPVRENRPPGSVRGAPGNRRPYLDPTAPIPLRGCSGLPTVPSGSGEHPHRLGALDSPVIREEPYCFECSPAAPNWQTVRPRYRGSEGILITKPTAGLAIYPLGEGTRQPVPPPSGVRIQAQKPRIPGKIELQGAGVELWQWDSDK
jgi:hypothetical protein